MNGARVRRALELAAGIAALGALFGPSLVAHVKRGMDPQNLNDDARVWVYPFERYHDGTLFPNDYLGEYAKACTSIGFRAVYALGTLFTSAETFSKVLSYVLFAIVLAAVWIAASRWGRAAAFLSVAFCLSGDVLFDRIVGGQPRTFGFPIMACAVAALVHGRMGALAVITAVGAAFYPAAAVPGGMTLAMVLLLFKARHRGTGADWSLKKRFAVLGATVLAAGLVQVPTTLSLRRFGSYIRPDDVSTYPEAGPGGRFYRGDRPPYGDYSSKLADEAPRALAGAGKPFTDLLGPEGDKERNPKEREVALLILGMTLMGFLGLAARDSGARRLATLAVASALGFTVAARVAPFFYIPQRYVVYPIPVLVMLAVPAAASAVPLLLGRRRGWTRPAAVLALGAAILLLVGGHGSDRTGYTARIDGKSKLFAFIGTLPKDALVAGWPSTEVMNNLPYATLRQAFITNECHMPFHAGFADEMRRRTRALFDAYLGSSEAPLVALRDGYKVTHLIIDERHFEPSAKQPGYFKPFDTWASQTYARGQRQGFEVPRLVSRAEIFRDGPYVVLDLAKIGPAHQASASPP